MTSFGSGRKCLPQIKSTKLAALICEAGYFPVLVSLVGFSLVGCKAEESAVEKPRPVLSEVASIGTFKGRQIVGIIQPEHQTQLSFRVPGRIVERRFEVGDFVNEGQVVATLDAVTFEQTNRAAAASVANSQAQYTNAVNAEARQRSLVESRSASLISLENAERARVAAQSVLATAQANLTKANEQLGYAQLHSNYTGIVTAISAEAGQVVSPGQIVMTVAKPNIRDAVIDVAEDVAASLSLGSRAHLELQLDPSQTSEGYVREISPQSDQLTRLRRIRIKLINPPDSYRLGTTVNTQLDGAKDKLLVPRSAILQDADDMYVWLVDSAKATVSKQKIVATPGVNEKFEVQSGLQAGMRYVTAGVRSLKDGQRVRYKSGGGE